MDTSLFLYICSRTACTASILCGTHDLHVHGIWHYDLKPANILVSFRHPTARPVVRHGDRDSTVSPTQYPGSFPSYNTSRGTVYLPVCCLSSLPRCMLGIAASMTRARLSRNSGGYSGPRWCARKSRRSSPIQTSHSTIRVLISHVILLLTFE